MQIEFIAGIGAIMTIIGFVTVFIKLGIDKGDSSRRLQNVEQKSIEHDRDIELHKKEISELQNICQKVAEHDKSIELHEKEIHGIQKETAGFMAKIDTTLSFIKDSLARLEKKQEKSDA